MPDIIKKPLSAIMIITFSNIVASVMGSILWQIINDEKDVSAASFLHNKDDAGNYLLWNVAYARSDAAASAFIIYLRDLLLKKYFNDIDNIPNNITDNLYLKLFSLNFTKSFVWLPVSDFATWIAGKFSYSGNLFSSVRQITNIASLIIADISINW